MIADNMMREESSECINHQWHWLRPDNINIHREITHAVNSFTHSYIIDTKTSPAFYVTGKSERFTVSAFRLILKLHCGGNFAIRPALSRQFST